MAYGLNGRGVVEGSLRVAEWSRQAATSGSDFNEILRLRCAALRMTMIGRPRRRNGLSGLNGLRAAAGADFYAPSAVAANLLSKGSRCCADKEVGLDGTY